MNDLDGGIMAAAGSKTGKTTVGNQTTGCPLPGVRKNECAEGVRIS